MSVESSPGSSEQATLFNLPGIIIVIPVLVVYMATCVSVPFFYRGDHRVEPSLASGAGSR